MQVQRRGGSANGLTLKGNAMEFLHTKLANGLEIVGELNESAQSMACAYLVKAGAQNETPDENGVSHFLEHMMFKGGERRSANDIKREFDELGAWYNAFAWTHWTFYYGRVLSECQPRLIDLLTDMMRPALRSGDFDMEKNVILEEIARAKDMPDWIAPELALEILTNGHPIGKPVLGTTESIATLERDQMMSYFERRYSPTNMVAALAGAFDWDAAVRQIEAATRDWEPFDVERETPKMEFAFETKVFQNKQLTLERIAWVWPGMSLQDERRRAAEVLADILGDSVGSRLYRELVEPGIVNTASMYHLGMDRFGMFGAKVSCGAERAGEVVLKVQNLLKEAVENGVAEDEIERAKQKYASRIALNSETPIDWGDFGLIGRLFPVAEAWAYRREYIDANEEIDRILSVTKEDVEALLAEDPFAKGALAALGPLETLDV